MKTIEQFKEHIEKKIYKNYRKDGQIYPMLFYYQNGVIYVAPIPGEYFESEIGKDKLAQRLRELAAEPGVMFVSVVMEAWAAKMEMNDPLYPLVSSGQIPVSRLHSSQRQDVIVWLISSIEKNEAIILEVDVHKRKIKGPWMHEGAKEFGGRFANLYAFQHN